MKGPTFSTNTLAGILAWFISIFSLSVVADHDETVMLNVDNFVRAETAAQLSRGLKAAGGINTWLHIR